MPAGVYTVHIKFLVEKDGSISQVNVSNDPGYGLTQAAVEILKKSPKWNPGIQNGRIVSGYKNHSITFTIE